MKSFYILTLKPGGRDRHITVTVDDRPATDVEMESESVQGAVRHLRSMGDRVTSVRLTWWEER